MPSLAPTPSFAPGPPATEYVSEIVSAPTESWVSPDAGPTPAPVDAGGLAPPTYEQFQQDIPTATPDVAGGPPPAGDFDPRAEAFVPTPADAWQIGAPPESYPAPGWHDGPQDAPQAYTEEHPPQHDERRTTQPPSRQHDEYDDERETGRHAGHGRSRALVLGAAAAAVVAVVGVIVVGMRGGGDGGGLEAAVPGDTAAGAAAAGRDGSGGDTVDGPESDGRGGRGPRSRRHPPQPQPHATKSEPTRTPVPAAPERVAAAPSRPTPVVAPPAATTPARVTTPAAAPARATASAPTPSPTPAAAPTRAAPVPPPPPTAVAMRPAPEPARVAPPPPPPAPTAAARPAGGGGNPADPFYAAAMDSLRQKKPTVAVDELKKGIAANPRDGRSYRLLGLALSMLGQEKSSVEAFEKAVALGPEDKDTAKIRAIIAEYYKKHPK